MMSDPTEGPGEESETSSSLELEFSNRVAGNLENKSGLLAAIFGDDEETSPDGLAGRRPEQMGTDPKVVAFPLKRDK